MRAIHGQHVIKVNKTKQLSVDLMKIQKTKYNLLKWNYPRVGCGPWASFASFTWSVANTVNNSKGKEYTATKLTICPLSQCLLQEK